MYTLLRYNTVSNPAIVKRFQTKKIYKSTRVTGSPSRPNFATVCGNRKPSWWGYKAEKKFDDMFIRFDTIPACDGHATTAIAVLA